MFKRYKSDFALVPSYTFSFLVVHRDFQDTISYEVNDDMIFEDVLIHICDRFGFYRNRVSITSNLGMEIDDLRVPVGQIIGSHGYYFKLVISEQDVTFSNAVADQIGGIQTVEEIVEAKKEGPPDSWNAIKEEISPATPGQKLDGNIKDMLQEVISDMFQVHADSWTIDPEGNVEVIVFPKLDTYISQLRVDIQASSSVKQLFTKVAFTCGFQLRELIIVPLKDETTVIDNIDIEVLELINTYGSAFLLYPKEIRSNLVSSSKVLAQDVADIISKYA